ncbi:hypothetical protein DVH05_011468 [Phytophthora capsici]|nr:hypothetical protein DVH05_011468 [Phytophthora capsici]
MRNGVRRQCELSGSLSVVAAVVIGVVTSPSIVTIPSQILDWRLDTRWAQIIGRESNMLVNVAFNMKLAVLVCQVLDWGLYLLEGSTLHCGFGKLVDLKLARESDMLVNPSYTRRLNVKVVWNVGLRLKIILSSDLLGLRVSYVLTKVK